MAPVRSGTVRSGNKISRRHIRYARRLITTQGKRVKDTNTAHEERCRPFLGRKSTSRRRSCLFAEILQCPREERPASTTPCASAVEWPVRPIHQERRGSAPRARVLRQTFSRFTALAFTRRWQSLGSPKRHDRRRENNRGVPKCHPW